MSENQKQWYVVRAIGGKENKVREYLEAEIRHNHLEDYITRILIPTKSEYSIRNGKRVSKEKILFPGYVYVKMVHTDQSWYICRNTRGVTGFVGPGSKPVPLLDEEVEKLGFANIRMENIDISVGDHVSIKQGPMEGFSGKVAEVNNATRKITVMVSMFGRETPVEVEHSQVALLD